MQSGSGLGPGSRPSKTIFLLSHIKVGKPIALHKLISVVDVVFKFKVSDECIVL